MKENMNEKVVVAEGIMENAQEVLRQMIAEGVTEAPLGDRFPNLIVVIGETDRTLVTRIDVPDDLKEGLANQPVYVAN